MDLDPDSQEGFERLKAFLLSQPKEELVRRLLDLSLIDSGLQRELKHWFNSPQMANDPQTLATLIKAMVTPVSTDMARRDVPHYVRRASEARPLLQELIRRDASAAARVLEHAILVAWQVTSDSTDDEQDAPEFATELMQVYLQALAAACPQPEDFAPRLVQFLRSDPIGLIEIGPIRAVLDADAVRRVGRQLDTVAAELDQRARQLQFDEAVSNSPGARRRPASQQSALMSLRREQDDLHRIRRAFMSATSG